MTCACILVFVLLLCLTCHGIFMCGLCRLLSDMSNARNCATGGDLQNWTRPEFIHEQRSAFGESGGHVAVEEDQRLLPASVAGPDAPGTHDLAHSSVQENPCQDTLTSVVSKSKDSSGDVNQPQHLDDSRRNDADNFNHRNRVSNSCYVCHERGHFMEFCPLVAHLPRKILFEFLSWCR